MIKASLSSKDTRELYKSKQFLARLRPESLKEFVTNKKTKYTLEESLTADQPPKNFLLVGPPGSGKTSLAHVIAHNLGCKKIYDRHKNEICEYTQGLLIYTIKSYTNNKLLHNLKLLTRFGCIESRITVHLFEEAHRISGNRQKQIANIMVNAEASCFFIFCTSFPSRIYKHIEDHCKVIRLGSLTHAEIVELLLQACKKEKTRVHSKVLQSIATQSAGNPREALKLLALET